MNEEQEVRDNVNEMILKGHFVAVKEYLRNIDHHSQNPLHHYDLMERIGLAEADEREKEK